MFLINGLLVSYLKMLVVSVLKYPLLFSRNTVSLDLARNWCLAVTPSQFLCHWVLKTKVKHSVTLKFKRKHPLYTSVEPSKWHQWSM